jgi:hypothetical protein
MTLYIASDIEERAVLWLFTGPTNKDDDFAEYVASIKTFDEICAGKDGAAVLMADAGNPAPPSPWRKKIADASARLLSKPAFVLVSSSPLIRGVVTAINWLRPPSYPFAAVADFADAEAFIAKTLGRAPPLARLLADARAQSKR